MTATLSIAVPAGEDKYARILTMNALNNTHHAVYARIREFWREHFKIEALREPITSAIFINKKALFAWCDITVDHVKPTKRNIDVAACLPCVKAGIDGLVLAGLLPDDTPEFVRSLTFRAPEYQKGIEALVITLTGELA